MSPASDERPMATELIQDLAEKQDLCEEQGKDHDEEEEIEEVYELEIEPEKTVHSAHCQEEKEAQDNEMAMTM